MAYEHSFVNKIVLASMCIITSKYRGIGPSSYVQRLLTLCFCLYLSLSVRIPYYANAKY